MCVCVCVSEEESVQSDNLSICWPVDVYACVRLFVCGGEDCAGDTKIFSVCYLALTSACRNMCVCVCLHLIRPPIQGDRVCWLVPEGPRGATDSFRCESEICSPTSSSSSSNQCP